MDKMAADLDCSVQGRHLLNASHGSYFVETDMKAPTMFLPHLSEFRALLGELGSAGIGRCHSQAPGPS